ncbi:glycoside hydrolase superfamily [Lentinula edodes]|uniref:glycoside hydrolase superfamily n=1 Tax=Lentinula edodes TaxID=5353 RepID=UPI001E8DF273|nr:glycoside hydrolase superfamily [Lentinula edodes]KAH7869997.1 glycoside hydrolase superfamily [Lentinula edodes]KAJ3915341.1 glucan endo-1,6-beta-glucosidase [Lentinula edodes]
MMFSNEFSLFFALVACIISWIQPVHGQTISGIVTSSDQSQLLEAITDAPSFASGSGSADIAIDETTVYQQMVGFGGSMTDSAALAMNNLKNADPAAYNKLLKDSFTTEGAALNYLRVPIGASDFSSSSYSLDDTSGDTSFTSFNISSAPAYLFSTLADIYAVNPNVKIHILPWSPPAWMKDGNTMNGGSLKSDMVSSYPTYLLKAVQGFKAKNLPIAAVSIQNEPQNSNPTYPSCTIDASTQATLAKSLRSLLNSNSLTDIKIIGYEHNWDDTSSYTIPMVDDAPNAFEGVAFHCYGGQVSETAAFSAQFPNIPMYQTECAGTTGSDWWTDVQWYVNNLWSANNTATGMMWIFASADNGKSPYPGSNSCGDGCRGMSTVTTSTVTFNQEYYSMAHFARAFTSDDGSTLGKRIQASVSDSTFNVVAYATGDKYSLVVLNSGGSSQKSISFQGKQATFTFPTGLTTLSWTGSNTSTKRMIKKRRIGA